MQRHRVEIQGKSGGATTTQQGQHDRLGYSIAEFSRLFNHTPSWGYRQVYLGHVAVICGLGDLRVPVAEVQRILNSARRYNPGSNSNGRAARIFSSNEDG